MIREHVFNSAWYGAPVGIVTDAQFFTLERGAQQALLRPYRWAEYRGEMDRSLARNVCAAGFYYVDTQLHFRVGLCGIEVASSAAALQATSAAQRPFVLESHQVASYDRERFFALPGMTHERVRDRYLRWSRDLMTRSPETCLCIQSGGRHTEGWFLSEPTARGLNLALAMASADATLSGALFYQRAMREYAVLGHRVGYASYSVANQPVQNIYARMGAIVTGVEHFYFWLNS